jgi:amino acid transporter
MEKFSDVLLGKPLSNEQHAQEKYNVPFGLAIMASDAVSSVAYAAEEILYVLVAVIGLMSYTWLGWISAMIIGLLFILTVSYLQIIRAYPQGGGAYIVAKENIGVRAGLIAGAALLIDYILTVAVSASAGVAAILSAFPSLSHYRVALVVILIVVLTILNLRGVSESSKIFSIPTYLFIFSMIFMIFYGIIKFSLYGAPEPMINEQIRAAGDITLFLILKAFSSGCSALTGLEAVSNSVPNFKEPSQRSAKIVMIALSVLIFLIFGGTSLLARFYHAVPVHETTVVAQIAYGVFGKTFMFYLVQITTAVILLMACNTAFTGFPMLMYVVSRDGYAPRQFTMKGKRLSLSIGIITLSFVACILVVIFGGITHNLIPLYSVGVFLSFTLAQSGMVNHWRSVRDKGWKKRSIINGFGAVITTITTLIIAYEKFSDGAWIVVIVIPILVLAMTYIKKHYDRVAQDLRITNEELKAINLDAKYNHIIVVPMASINKAALGALEYAKSISSDVIALNVSTNKEELDKFKARWEMLNTDVVLVAKYSPYRAVVNPLLQYIGAIADAASASEKITVVLPQFIPHRWWGQLLHNHTSFIIRETMLRRKNVVVATFPYHLHDE